MHGGYGPILATRLKRRRAIERANGKSANGRACSGSQAGQALRKKCKRCSAARLRHRKPQAARTILSMSSTSPDQGPPGGGEAPRRRAGLQRQDREDVRAAGRCGPRTQRQSSPPTANDKPEVGRRHPAGRHCGLQALTAVAYTPSGVPLLAGTCSRPGTAGIFPGTGGAWQATGPAIPAAPGRQPITVIRLCQTGNQIVALLTAASGRAEVITSDGSQWQTLPALPRHRHPDARPRRHDRRPGRPPCRAHRLAPSPPAATGPRRRRSTSPSSTAPQGEPSTPDL